MNKRDLLVLRHGKSDWPPGVPDKERPLKKRGKKNATRMGLWLVEQDLLPDVILSSPAKRALATAKKVCDAIGYPYSRIDRHSAVYLADVEDLMNVLHGLPDNARRVLLVGHNPGLEHLLIHLCRHIEVPDDGKLLPTCTLAWLQTTRPWSTLSADDARLLSIIRPKSLSATFPFETEQGTEWRERPDYYYFQSAVIPYRVHNDRLEVLLVTGRKNGDWTLPKGIVNKDMTPRDSAAREAFEESGVKGIMREQPLGRCDYFKWGANCELQVFAMEVDEWVDDAHWPESWRRRQWVGSDEVENYLNNTDICKMIMNLKSLLI